MTSNVLSFVDHARTGLLLRDPQKNENWQVESSFHMGCILTERVILDPLYSKHQCRLQAGWKCRLSGLSLQLLDLNVHVVHVHISVHKTLFLEHRLKVTDCNEVCSSFSSQVTNSSQLTKDCPRVSTDSCMAWKPPLLQPLQLLSVEAYPSTLPQLRERH